MSVYVNLVFRSYFTSPFLVLLGAKNSSERLSCTKVGRWNALEGHQGRQDGHEGQRERVVERQQLDRSA
eukprot:SAG31_NODE_798_length_12027_cov_8.190057_7_plen_69_part_00